MPSRPSTSSSATGSVTTGQTQNLNPFARAFTPIASAPASYNTSYAPSEQAELAYHHAMAVEAAMMAAQVPTPQSHSPDAQQAVQRIYNTGGGPSEKAPSRASSAPEASTVTVVDHENPPKTPKGQHIERQCNPTPPAYTFNDDDEFYPGTDPRLVYSGRAAVFTYAEK